MPEDIKTIANKKNLTKEDMAELLDKFKIDVAQDASINLEQRGQANIDMRMVMVQGGQWEDFLEDQFEGRVQLEFDLISNHIQRFMGEWNQNRVAVDYRPTDSAGDQKDAMLLNNLFRTDYRQFSGKESLDNAVQEAVITGQGFLKLGTIHEDEEDPENQDRRIVFKPLFNGYNSVYFNKGAQRKDKRDAIHCTILTEMNRDEFKRLYPDKDAVSVFNPSDRKEFNFSSTNPNNIYVGTRYDVMHVNETVFIYDNLNTLKKEVFSEKEHEEDKSTIKKDPSLRFSEEKTLRRRRIRKSVFSGQDMLKAPKIIAGKWIPIIPVYAFRGYSDGVEWSRGLVRKNIDPQRMYNMQISQLAENAAMQSTDIPIVDPKQITPEYESDWTDLTNAPYVRMEALRDKDGNIVHQGPLGFLSAPAVSPSMQALLQVVPLFMQEMTGGSPQETANPRLESGKAIIAERKIRDLNTQPIMDNIFSAVEHIGEVYQSIATENYADRREIVLLKEDGTESNQQLIKATFDESLGQIAEISVLRNKKFRAYSDVGPQYETQREADVEMFKDLLELSKDTPALGDYTPIILAEMFNKLPGIGKGLQKFNRDRMIQLGLIDPETDEEKKALISAQENQQSEEDKLFEAAAKQADSEAEERTSKVADNLASAQKKGVEAQKILREIPRDDAKAGADIRKIESDINQQIFENVEGLPLN